MPVFYFSVKLFFSANVSFLMPYLYLFAIFSVKTYCCCSSSVHLLLLFIKNVSTKQDSNHFWHLLTAHLIEILQGAMEKSGAATVSC